VNEPASGIYLDATLTVIRDRVEQRIDVLQRRRRRGVLALVLSLVFVAAVSGTAAAAVLLAPRSAPVSPIVAAQQLQCVAGSDVAKPAYFGARFAASSRLSLAAIASVCAAAWPRVEAGVGSVKDVAAELVRAAGADLVTIDSAYVGPIPTGFGAAVPPMAVCVRTADDAKYVLSATQGELAVSPAEWGRRCALNPGFDFAGVDVAGVDITGEPR
jgi:hypothetical protein